MLLIFCAIGSLLELIGSCFVADLIVKKVFDFGGQ
jgi:hypothetical protein